MAFKQLLRVKKISQADLAQKLGIGKSNITRWINGDTKPAWDRRLVLAGILDIPVNKLEDYFGPVAEEKYSLMPTQSDISTNVTHHIHESPRAYTIELPYVPIEARAGFAHAVSTTAYSLSSFDTYMLSFVNDPGTKYSKSCAVFEVNGDSMEETLPHGSKIIATLVPREKWANVRERVVIVSFADHLVIKRVRGNDLNSQNHLLLHSDTQRPVSPYPVPLSDIHSVWLVEEFADRPLIR